MDNETSTISMTPTSSKPKQTVTALPVTSTETQETSENTEITKKVFYERVAEASGVNKNKAKPVVDAVLAELGAALMAGEELSLPPLGKISVNREKDVGNAHVLITKIRRSKAMLAKAEAAKAASAGGDDGES